MTWLNVRQFILLVGPPIHVMLAWQCVIGWRLEMVSPLRLAVIKQ
jgi:hypothetical protein